MIRLDVSICLENLSKAVFYIEENDKKELLNIHLEDAKKRLNSAISQLNVCNISEETTNFGVMFHTMLRKDCDDICANFLYNIIDEYPGEWEKLLELVEKDLEKRETKPHYISVIKLICQQENREIFNINCAFNYFFLENPAQEVIKSFTNFYSHE